RLRRSRRGRECNLGRGQTQRHGALDSARSGRSRPRLGMAANRGVFPTRLRKGAGPMGPVRHYRVRRKTKALVIRKEHVALGIFALLVVFGPLTFGAVDRLTQVGLLVLLAIG